VGPQLLSFEPFDRIAVWIFELDLSTDGTNLHIVPKLHAGSFSSQM